MTPTSKPFAGYVRVSRVAGRGGDSFISPEVQRETIERLAKAHDIELAEIVKETDVSGGKSIDKRELGRLVAKVEAGEYGGLIVWKVSRFSRSLADGVVVAQRIKDAGGRLIAEELDSGSKNGGLLLGLWLGLAEDELDARRDGWRAAQERAAKRGTFIGRTPLGYERRETDPKDGHLTGPLYPEPTYGPVVSELFTLRARGASLADCSRHLEAATGKRASRAALSSMFRNETYLGKIVNGTIRQDGTHEPLTDETTWARCQRKDSRKHRDGSLAGQGILAGFIRCSGCGGIMSVTASGKGDKRRASYSCRGRRADGDCPAPASILIDHIDPLVLPAVESYKSQKDGSLKDMLRESEQVVLALGAARKELDAYLETVSVVEVGKEAFLQGLASRRDKLDKLEAEWQASETRADALLGVAEGENAELLHDRAIVRELYESVTVSAIPTDAEGRKLRKTPIEERVALVPK